VTQVQILAGLLDLTLHPRCAADILTAFGHTGSNPGRAIMSKEKSTECPFCKIDAEKTRLIWSGKNTVVFLSNPRLMRGHILVIPKRHVEKITELTSEEQTELFETVLKFQERILSKLSRGCDIRQNYRPFQKQDNLKVNHLHIHLQPRELFDELYEKCQIAEKEIFEELSNEEKEELTKLFS
jgi:histidine triad (HIT) family protein